MAVNRTEIVDQNFRTRVAEAASGFQRVHRKTGDPILPGCGLTQARAVELLECQIASRWLDYVARELKAENKSFYTIGSAGHEGNAMLGQLTRWSDPAFLHYRSGGFVLARARQVAGQTPIFDTCLGLAASKEDPIAGGRHKVWGSSQLNIPPQTSTIASHLPKSVGYAFFLERRLHLGLAGADGIPEDSIVVCSFGDASVNHSTAQGAFNSAAWASFQRLPLPILFICEDNGIGISVDTPVGWVERSFRARPGIVYFQADGLSLKQGYAQVEQAVDFCRRKRCPVFLHLRTVRLLGHAGTDVEQTYMPRHRIEAREAMDPLIRTALELIDEGVLSPEEVMEIYEGIAEQVRAAGQEAALRPRHESADSVMSPLKLPDLSAVPRRSAVDCSPEERLRFWSGKLPETQRPRHMAQLICWGLQDLMLSDEKRIVFGEDVARKGGVYRVTADLYERFGVGRVFNTLLDEQTILGLAIGAGQMGLTPIPEIQYLAYVYNAVDQLRGEACSLQFFSERQFRNPMVVRVAGLAYQKGFGGHFHNDNSFASLREIPGIVIVTASNGADAVRLMRTCVRLAETEGTVVVFIEPIALYMAKHLVAKGDWECTYPAPHEMMDFAEVGLHGDPEADVLLITYGNGYFLSRQACWDLQQEGIATRILELRFLTPLNRDAILQAARGRSAVVIVDESRKTGSISEEIAALLVESMCARTPRIERVCGHDTYIPLGTAWQHVLPSRRDIYDAVKRCQEAARG